MSGRVLVVDDDPVLLALFTQVLPSQGYHVRTVPTAEEMFRQLPLEKPDVLILDYFLPDSTGLAVCRELRTNPAFTRLRILLITAQSGEGIRAECVLAGANDYLAKPI